MPLTYLLLISFASFFAPATPAPLPEAPVVVEASNAAAAALYVDCGLSGVLNETAFVKALQSRVAHHAAGSIIAVADMTRPSNEKRLFIIDLDSRKLLLRTWVAHGKNSGDLYCTTVSNVSGSLQTSKGLYRVGQKIISPKHGDALLLHGLDAGVNSAAQQREIIIHAANYVGADFIAQHGRLGRSFGCPAVAPEVMPKVMDLLEGQLLFVFAK
ncbi:MAG: murein L,D-transpeptidase catalytic domain family protein [Flavobacteriales bacterium]